MRSGRGLSCRVFGLCYPLFGRCAIILTKRIARSRIRSSTSEAIYVIQFGKFQDHQRQRSEANSCIVGFPPAIGKAMGIAMEDMVAANLAYQRAKREGGGGVMAW